MAEHIEDVSHELKDIIISEHAEYESRLAELNFFFQSYAGGKEMLVTGHIFKHIREHDGDYIDRVKRAYYFNYVADGIDVYASHIFKPPITRVAEDSIGDERLQGFLKSGDVDRQGTNMTTFMRQAVTIPMMIAGYTFVLVDKPSQNGVKVNSRADEIAQGLDVPYFVEIPPEAMINWGIDALGKFIFCRYKETTKEPSAWNKSAKENVRYWTWTRDEWFVHEVSSKGILTVAIENGVELKGVHDLGEVPIVLFRYRKKRKCRVVGKSMIEDIAYINRGVLNQTSLVDEFNYEQAFNILKAKDGIPMEGIDTESEGTGDEITIGRRNILPFEAEFIAPSAEIAQWQQTWIKDILIFEIYRTFRLKPQEATRPAESGESKRRDFHETNSKIAEVADTVENSEAELLRLWLLRQEIESTVFVDYPDDFDIQSINAEIEHALGIDSLPLGATFKSRYFQRLSKRLDEKLSAEQRVDVDGEIEDEQIRIAQIGAEI